MRIRTQLITFLGMVALLLGVVGIYGVMSYLVSQRTREFGIRLALGARPWALPLVVVGQGLCYTLAGIGLGLCAAVFSPRSNAKPALRGGCARSSNLRGGCVPGRAGCCGGVVRPGSARGDRRSADGLASRVTWAQSVVFAAHLRRCSGPRRCGNDRWRLPRAFLPYSPWGPDYRYVNHQSRRRSLTVANHRHAGYRPTTISAHTA